MTQVKQTLSSVFGNLVHWHMTDAVKCLKHIWCLHQPCVVQSICWMVHEQIWQSSMINFTSECFGES